MVSYRWARASSCASGESEEICGAPRKACSLLSPPARCPFSPQKKKSGTLILTSPLDLVEPLNPGSLSPCNPNLDYPPNEHSAFKRKMVFQDPPVSFQVNWWEGSTTRVLVMVEMGGFHGFSRQAVTSRLVFETRGLPSCSKEVFFYKPSIASGKKGEPEPSKFP